ncbi:TetR/AcrR family transcriptional regulator [Acrocarpospora sp. B8E8]|uniref:TetR/AcrR family transcriptional regulator n=1 Tax=Acrocarpospora sp. B8E8 TaxID=3153572 RepID=UPI00325E038F
MSRKKDQAARRKHLLEAARKAILKRGLVTVGVRDIAQAASMSPGSVTYYFPTIDELLRQVQADAIARFAQARWELVRTIDDPVVRLRALIERGVATGPDDELLCLLNEFTGLIRRNPIYQVSWKSLNDSQISIYESVITTGAALGVFTLSSPALSIARNFVGLEDIYGFHVVMGASMIRDEALELIYDFAMGAVGCDLRDPQAAAPEVLAGPGE